MAKLGLPFEYGWRRETRLRGINKNGRMIGEVFYYTPTDKRMRSWNDVQKYLKHAQILHERGTKEEEDVDNKEESDTNSQKGDDQERSDSPDEDKLVIAEDEMLSPSKPTSMSCHFVMLVKQASETVYHRKKKCLPSVK